MRICIKIINMALATTTLLLLSMNTCNSFSINPPSSTSAGRLRPLYLNRRSFINTSTATIFSSFVASTAVVHPKDVAYAASIPMVTVFEFEQILKDSGEMYSSFFKIKLQSNNSQCSLYTNYNLFFILIKQNLYLVLHSLVRNWIVQQLL